MSRLTGPSANWIRPDLLERSDSKSQKELNREDRLLNLKGRIRVRKGRPIPEQAILVDDVCTTGATLIACAAALREAGCRRVDALTIFRD
jgi:predicted amidophosphoribosyltransferase